MKPTRRHELFDGRVTLLAFGREHGNMDVRGGSADAVHWNNPGVLSKVRLILQRENCRGYAPLSVQNAKIPASLQSFTKEWIRDRLFCGDLRHQNRMADGIILRTGGTAHVMPFGTAAVVILYGARTHLVISILAGRKALINHGRIFRQKKPRSRESVLDRAFSLLIEQGERVDQIHAHIGLAAGPDALPAYASEKETSALVRDTLVRYGPSVFDGPPEAGRIKLAEIARQQLELHRIRPDQIAWDGIDTFRERGENGLLAWNDPATDGGAHNLAVVIRTR